MDARLKRGILVTLVASPILAGILYGLLLPRASSLPLITQARFALIKSGMTLAEIEGILKAPPGDYRTKVKPTGFELQALRNQGGAPRVLKADPTTHVALVLRDRGITTRIWYGDEGTILLSFYDEDQTVSFLQFRPTNPAGKVIAR